MKISPHTVIASATAQKSMKALAVARAAASGFCAPKARDTRDAPPTPTVVETAPSASRTGATTFTAASAVGPTPQDTNQALVSAYMPNVATAKVVCEAERHSKGPMGSDPSRCADE